MHACHACDSCSNLLPLTPDALQDPVLNTMLQVFWWYIQNLMVSCDCRDVVEHVMAKVAAFQNDPGAAPRWFHILQWEDVLVGLLVSDYVDELQSHPGKSLLRHSSGRQMKS